MALDPFLPVAPAQVKVLVLPVGPMHRDRFAGFVDRLKAESAVQLRDVSADSRPNRNMFNPLAFPDGVIFFDLTTHAPQAAHLALAPFELYREPLVVLALADGVALQDVDYGSKRQSAQSAAARSVPERNVRALYQELEALRDTHTKALVHRVLIVDHADDPAHPLPLPDEGMATVPPAAQSKRTTVKTVMADIASLLLAELTTLARSFEGMAFIESPAGTHARDDETTALSLAGPARRNSQFSLPTRSGSVSSMSALDRAQARMSMPVPFKASTGPTPGRPSTPVRNSGVDSPDNHTHERSESTGTDRTDRTASPHETDRVAVQGFGPGGLNERWRNKGKSRVTIVVASLYLQAGRWTDALKELIDGATVARAINDHLWHGKALELIVVCLLLLAWAGIEFQVPAVCRSPPEKGSAAQQAAIAAEAAAEKADPTQPKWLRSLQLVLPDLLDRILGLYARISAEHLPPLPLAEATLRFSSVLAALHMAGGTVGRPFLQTVVEGTSYGLTTTTTTPRLSVVPSRAQVTGMLFKAFPSSSTELLTISDRTVILSGIAAVLGRLGYQRKKAMVLRELVSVLIAGLVEARTRGAAEMGIHPAAGLVSASASGQSHTHGAGALDLAEGDIEEGVDAFLGMLLKAYGVVELVPSRPVTETVRDNSDKVDDSDEAIVRRIREQATARMHGLPGTKLNLLRACINFCEALPDFAGVLAFSGDLLRTGGSGIAPGPVHGDAAPSLARDEQARLLTNIAKTSGLARRLGLGDLCAEYWDEFLLRGVKLDPVPAACTAVAHTTAELPGHTVTVTAATTAARTSQDVDPFIHNPFVKASAKAAVAPVPVLVADEPATFKLTLQNPYDVDIDIESIRLETEGAEFEAFADSTLLGPFRTQQVKVSGMPRAAGALTVTGAVVRVRGCRERRFLIFTQPWSPVLPDKAKTVGVNALSTVSSTVHTVSGTVHTELAGPAPVPDRLALQVIPAQPMVVVASTTLPQSSVMVLEGERQVFSVTLTNLSTTTPVDFLVFSFTDATQAAVQTALAQRDAAPADLYELELVLATKQAVRLRPTSQRRFIAPGATATYEFEILGKPGLTSASIHVDYAHLGVPANEVASPFYTRQATLHLTVTVNASVDVARMDVLPVHGRLPDPLWARCSKSVVQRETDTDYCLLLLDLRNAWPSQMRVELAVGRDDDTISVAEDILPGHTARMLLPLRRVFLDDPHAAIPALNPQRQRQFVVSTGKVSPDAERATREAFWYRERVLETLRATWTEVASGTHVGTSGSSRSGTVELRSMRLTPRMIEALKVDEVGIDVVVCKKTKKKKTQIVRVDTPVDVCVRITNRTRAPLHPTLRLTPALCHRPVNIALDYTRKLAWTGALQQTLPLLDAHATAEVRLGVTALCRGEFEVTASVEETRVYQTDLNENENENDTTRPRSNTETLLLDAVLGPRERRIWHSRKACHFVVVD